MASCARGSSGQLGTLPARHSRATSYCKAAWSVAGMGIVLKDDEPPGSLGGRPLRCCTHKLCGLIHARLACTRSGCTLMNIHAPDRLLLATFRPVRSYGPKLMLAGMLPVS